MKRLSFVFFAFVLASTQIAASGSGEADAKAKAAPASTAVDIKVKESPIWAAMVAEKKLPPLAERLPEKPFILNPVESLGEYGGSWRFLIAGPNFSLISDYSMPTLTQWSQDQQSIVPYLAESYSSNAAKTEWTIKLRKGAKWSDGVPFTADDLVFFFDDISGYKDFRPTPSGTFSTGAGYGKMEKISDLEVKYSFPAPHPMFDIFVAKNEFLYAPKHYLMKYHPKYTDLAKVEELAKKEGFNSWKDCLNFKLGYGDPEVPRMDAWLPTAKPPQTNYSFRRNPYFWAVDTAGRQLPYLDEIMLLAVAADAMNAKIIAGEPNFQIYGGIGALTEYKQAQKEQGYEIIEWTRLEVSDASIQLNLNTADPVLQKIFRDKNFRIALSYAIDRDAINKTLYFGLMEPVQATLNKIDGDVFKKEYYKAFTEYKPDESNRLLDGMGLTKRDSDGYRMRPDGKRLTIVAEFQNWATAIADQFRMIREDYKKIGIDFIPKPLESSIFQQRAATDQTEATGFPFGKTKTDTGLVPINTGVRYAPLWGLWYATKGANGIKPDDPLQLTLMDTWTNILQETDVAKRTAMYDTILKAQAENLWIIATVGPTKTLVLRKPWFRNVPKNYYVSWHHGRNYAASYPMQYWIEKAHQND